MVTLSDVLFFTSGLKQLSPMRLGWDLSLAFLHDPDKDNNLFPYPKASTCGPLLQLPIVHKSIYDAFKDAKNFAIGNSKGFGFIFTVYPGNIFFLIYVSTLHNVISVNYLFYVPC